MKTELKRFMLFYIVLIFGISVTSIVAAHNKIENFNDKNQCISYTYKVVKPLLGYLHQMNEDMATYYNATVEKDREIKELNEKLVQHDLNVLIIKELRTQNDFQQKAISKITNDWLAINRYITKQYLLKYEQYENKISANLALIKEQNKHIEKCTAQMHLDSKKLQDIEILVKNYEQKLKEYEEKFPSSCNPYGNSTGIQRIKLAGNDSFDVLCDSQTAGPGWMVIQQRFNGSVDFHRNWANYSGGFGSFGEEFFLGLKYIHQLTNASRYELYIHMEAFDGTTKYVRYSQFAIANELEQYRLISVGMFSGNETFDTLTPYINKPFSTFDHDNDEWAKGVCANLNGGGWWYGNCVHSNLNGRYYNQQVKEYDSIYWRFPVTLKTVKMLMRPRAN